MSKWDRFVDWGNRLYRTCNRITIFVLYVTIMLILGAMIYGANQQRATSNITVTYSRPSYTVSFDPNGGGVTPSSKTVKLGDNYGTLPDITRVGYDFAGWSREDKTIVSPTTQNTTVGDHTLTAAWTPKTYSLTLYDNKNILYGGDLTETQDVNCWGSASIVTEDGITCSKISGALSTYRSVGQSILGKISPNTQYIIGLKVKVTNYVAGSTYPFLATYLEGYYESNGSGNWPSLGGSHTLSGYSGKGWQNIGYHFTSTNTDYSIYSSANIFLYARDFTGDVFFRDYSLALATNTAKSVTYDSAIASVSALSRTGYTFQGYYTQPVGGTKIFNADGSVMLKQFRGQQYRLLGHSDTH